MQDFEYKNELTADGSPTLRMPPTWEPMHSLDGAFSETLYIYQPTVSQALNMRPTEILSTAAAAVTEPVTAPKTPRLLSIGLGLGYNEILIACEALKMNTPQVFIDSYESIFELRSNFAKWILGEPSVLQEVYDKILELYSAHYQLPPDKILDFLKQQLQTQHLQLHDAITAASTFKKSQAILFDAFSHKTSPELWTEEFLENFMTMAADEECFLSTYASKGTLHRALKNHNFTSEKRPGFAKKRESTFAHRQKPTAAAAVTSFNLNL